MHVVEAALIEHHVPGVHRIEFVANHFNRRLRRNPAKQYHRVASIAWPAIARNASTNSSPPLRKSGYGVAPANSSRPGKRSTPKTVVFDSSAICRQLRLIFSGTLAPVTTPFTTTTDSRFVLTGVT